MPYFIYQIENLTTARQFLKDFTSPITVTNCPGSVKYYGMVVLDYIFTVLKDEFPQITQIIVNVEDDHAAFFAAIKFNYRSIIYSGRSQKIKEFLANY